VSAQARFLRDAVAVPGARYVIVLEGINDIGFSLTPAARIIAGYQNLIAAAHAAGLKILGATLTPFQGAGYYSAAGEAEREAVNRWIRTSGAFDGGDHLHPNDAGYQAMANAINVAVFRS